MIQTKFCLLVCFSIFTSFFHPTDTLKRFSYLLFPFLILHYREGFILSVYLFTTLLACIYIYSDKCLFS